MFKDMFCTHHLGYWDYVICYMPFVFKSYCLSWVTCSQKLLDMLDETFLAQKVQVQSFQSKAWSVGVLGKTLLLEILAFFMLWKRLGIMRSRRGGSKNSCGWFWERGLTLNFLKSLLKNAIITEKDNIFRIKNKDRKERNHYKACSNIVYLIWEGFSLEGK